MSLRESDLDYQGEEDFRREEEEEREERPKLSTAQERKLRVRIEDPISKIAEWIAGRDEELAEILRKDGPKMASLLSRLAANANTPMIVVLGIQAFASLLEPVDAFGRTIIHVLKRMRESRANRQHLEHVTPEEGEEPETPGFEPPPESDDSTAEPWRIPEGQ